MWCNNKNKIKTSKILNISNGTFNNWFIKFNYYFINNTQLTINDYNTIKKQNIHKLTKQHKFKDNIIDYVNNNNGCTLNNINKDITKDNISLSTICRILKNNNISKKRFNTRIVCKDIDKIKEDRQNFSLVTDNSFYNYISIDESSFCVNDILNYGYSQKNVEIKKMVKHKHNKLRYTLLSAIDTNGVVCYKIFNTSVNGELYKQFIDDNKLLFINKTILHDNVRFHHSKILKEYCSNNNINLRYTPAYSPEYNPIELFFSTVKKYFRKLDHINLINDIIESIKYTNTNINFKKYYDHSYKYIEQYK